MAVNVEKFTSAGIEYAFWARNSSAGYPYGPTGTLANGADAGMSQILGVQSMGVSVQQPRRVNVPGDDGVQSIYIFQPEELPSGDLVLGVFDVNLVAQSQGIKVYADGDFDMTYLQPEAPIFSDLTIVTNSQAKSKDSASSGTAGYQVVIYPKVNAVPLGAAGISNAEATSYTHALIANKSSIKPWGQAFSSTNDGTTAAAILGPFYSENRVTMHTHVSDASDTTFTLSYTPAAASAAKVKAWRNGTALTYTTDFSVNASTKVVTLVAAGTAGDVVVVRYEWVN